MGTTVDLGDYSKVGELPPLGRYRFEIQEGAKLTESSNGNSYNVILDLMIVDSPDPDFENYPKRVWLNTGVASKPFFKRYMEAIFQEPFDSENPQFEIDEDDVLENPDFSGKTFLADIKHGTYKNQPQIELDTWYADDGETEVEIFEEKVDEDY